MRVKGLLFAMVAGSVLIMAAFRREPEPEAAKEPEPEKEVPWLSREATNQIIGGDAMPGPLFDDLLLGSPVPAAARDRIAAFARDNDVEIDLEEVDGYLAA